MPCKNAVEISDTLNRLNGSKEKTGYWIEYLNSNMSPAPCKKASYGQLAYYWRGQRVLPMGPPKRPLSGVPIVTYERNSLNSSTGFNSVDLLDGDVTFRYRRSTLTRTYKNGILIKEVNTALHEDFLEIIYYTDHYINNPYTCKIVARSNGASRVDYYGVIDGRIQWIAIQ